MGSNERPLVLIGCTPYFGHMSPLRAIATDLVERGYEVTWVSSNHYQGFVEESGATFVPILGYGDLYEGDLKTKFAARDQLPPGPEQLAYDLEHAFVNCISSQYEALQRAMKSMTEKYPGRPIVQVNESVFMGALPIMLGAKGIKPAGTLGIGIIPICLSSIDLPAFGPGLPPDSSPEGRIRNAAMVKSVYEGWAAPVQKKFAGVVEETGAATPTKHFFDLMYLAPDRFLQMCTPSAEYPRSDAPASIHFAGGLPKGKRAGFTEKPSWWDQIVNPGGKTVVAVSQGSVALNYSDLTIPAIEAFKDREDIILVVALGKKGATLDASIPVGKNTFVSDFIPFDELLPLCSVFITNGGYGGFQHALSNGTPVVVAGATEDKPEVAARAEWAGVGINLRTGTATPEAISTAVDEILKNPKYKERSKELEAEMATFDPMEAVSRNIDELAAGLK